MIERVKNMENIPSVDDIKSAKPDIGNIDHVDTGGFKAVYKATVRGRIEALKVVYLPPQIEEDGMRDEIVARVKREIEALKRCDSECLVQLGTMELELMRIGSHDYLVYSEEFIEGESLRDQIQQGYRPNLAELIVLTRCLMKALSAIQAIDYIHRDVKPGNIITTGNEERPFVLLDLGIAYKIHGTQITAKRGGPPGTILYMAPELFRPDYKNLLDIRSDIYSAGVTIFEFASGIHPLAKRGEDEHTTIYRIVTQPPIKLFGLRPDLPQTFCQIIDRCIKKMPALRYTSPSALLKSLEEIS